MMQLSEHLAEETFELQTYEVLRNTILCSISRYDEFLAACSELVATQDYVVTASASVSHNKMYLADNEGVIRAFEVYGNELEQFEQQ